MSKKFYAVQFRSMRTAIHNITVFDDKEIARQFCGYVEEEQDFPEEHEFDYGADNYIRTYEIDHRKPPTDIQGTPLEYLNSDCVPDVYNY